MWGGSQSHQQEGAWPRAALGGRSAQIMDPDNLLSQPTASSLRLGTGVYLCSPHSGDHSWSPINLR